MEKQISTTLIQIQGRIAGLKLYKQIYKDKHELDQQLQSYVIEVYDKLIEFCIIATRYYCQKGYSKSPIITRHRDTECYFKSER